MSTAKKAFEPKILFTKETMPFILETFGKSINDDGLIVEKNTGEPVLTPDGDHIEAANFAGMKKGSEIFIKDDLFSLMKLVEGKY